MRNWLIDGLLRHFSGEVMTFLIWDGEFTESNMHLTNSGFSKKKVSGRFAPKSNYFIMKFPRFLLITALALLAAVLVAQSIWVSHADLRVLPGQGARQQTVPLADTVISDATAVALPEKKRVIRVGLLLDTSNSMDGLIDQARAQLWEFVNAMAREQVDGDTPDLELALYEYGNDGLSSRNGYLRQVCAFTSELDLISEKLFALTTNGGYEYCATVIQAATRELIWNDLASDVQVLFIAGNEEFYQGGVSWKKACSDAREKHITVNTIYCGEYESGVREGWKAGAQAGGGRYMNIDSNLETVFIDAPQDEELSLLNSRLNETYIYYGAYGQDKFRNQEIQDSNAGSYGKASFSSRAVSKASSFYKNDSWDLVDASREKGFDISKVERQYLPEQYKHKSDAELLVIIGINRAERERITLRINALNSERSAWIAANSKGTLAPTLSSAMLDAIRTQISSAQ